MSRRYAREALLALMYEYTVTGQQGHETLDVMGDILSDSLTDSDREYIGLGVSNFLTNQETIDEVIKSSLKSWSISRLARVDLSILRLAVVEIIYFEDIPEKVAINEAVELGKKYSSDKSPKFINGVLAGCLKNIDVKKVDS
jgi:transcription antitermination protein NusB